MSILKGLRDCIAFLTTIPVGMSGDLEDMARHLYLFPLVGAMIGAIAGLCALIFSQFLPKLVAGMLTFCVILILTGLHHMDGLVDFGDGVMAQGTPEEKIRVMHDTQVGVGGSILALLVIVVTALCISELNPYVVFQALVISEVSAKLAMVTSAALGKSARTAMGDPVVRLTRPKHFGVAFTVSIAMGYLLSPTLPLQIFFSTVIFTGVIAGLVMMALANRHFGGMTGDVFGATNEIGRMASLLLLLGILG